MKEQLPNAPSITVLIEDIIDKTDGKSLNINALTKGLLQCNTLLEAQQFLLELKENAYLGQNAVLALLKTLIQVLSSLDEQQAIDCFILAGNIFVEKRFTQEEVESIRNIFMENITINENNYEKIARANTLLFDQYFYSVLLKIAGKAKNIGQIHAIFQDACHKYHPVSLLLQSRYLYALCCAGESFDTLFKLFVDVRESTTSHPLYLKTFIYVVSTHLTTQNCDVLLKEVLRYLPENIFLNEGLTCIKKSLKAIAFINFTEEERENPTEALNVVVLMIQNILMLTQGKQWIDQKLFESALRTLLLICTAQTNKANEAIITNVAFDKVMAFLNDFKDKNCKMLALYNMAADFFLPKPEGKAYVESLYEAAKLICDLDKNMTIDPGKGKQTIVVEIDLHGLSYALSSVYLTKNLKALIDQYKDNHHLLDIKVVTGSGQSHNKTKKELKTYQATCDLLRKLNVAYIENDTFVTFQLDTKQAYLLDEFDCSERRKNTLKEENIENLIPTEESLQKETEKQSPGSLPKKSNKKKKKKSLSNKNKLPTDYTLSKEEEALLEEIIKDEAEKLEALREKLLNDFAKALNTSPGFLKVISDYEKELREFEDTTKEVEEYLKDPAYRFNHLLSSDDINEISRKILIYYYEKSTDSYNSFICFLMLFCSPIFYMTLPSGVSPEKEYSKHYSYDSQTKQWRIFGGHEKLEILLNAIKHFNIKRYGEKTKEISESGIILRSFCTAYLLECLDTRFNIVEILPFIESQLNKLSQLNYNIFFGNKIREKIGLGDLSNYFLLMDFAGNDFFTGKTKEAINAINLNEPENLCRIVAIFLQTEEMGIPFQSILRALSHLSTQEPEKYMEICKNTKNFVLKTFFIKNKNASLDTIKAELFKSGGDTVKADLVNVLLCAEKHLNYASLFLHFITIEDTKVFDNDLEKFEVITHMDFPFLISFLLLDNIFLNKPLLDNFLTGSIEAFHQMAHKVFGIIATHVIDVFIPGGLLAQLDFFKNGDCFLNYMVLYVYPKRELDVIFQRLQKVHDHFKPFFLEKTQKLGLKPENLLISFSPENMIEENEITGLGKKHSI